MDGHFCGRMFDTSNEDKSELCVGCTKSLTTGAWTYTSAEDIWGIPIVGHYNTYSGGGYIQKLDFVPPPVSKNSARNIE
jgi:membrane peptidoglycan carboxypeptidase